MDKIRVRFIVVPLFFVLALVVVRSEGNRKFLDTFFGSRVSWISQDELDHETVEQLWIHCWKKIDHSSNSIPEFRLNFPYDVEKAIHNLPLKVQESLLDCLTRRNLLLATPNHDPVSTTWLEKFVDFFLEFSSVPRRQLKSRTRPHHRRKPKTANLEKDHLHHDQEPQTANLDKKQLHNHRKPKTTNLDKKHIPQTANVKKHPRRRHKPQTTNVPLREKQPRQQQQKQTAKFPSLKDHPRQLHKPQNATLPLHKKSPNQKQKLKTANITIPKRPRHPINQRAPNPNIAPSDLSNSLALAPSRTPTHAPTPTPVPTPAPAPVHISPEPSLPPQSPVPIPPGLDTSAPPSVVKPPPVGVSPLASPLKSENDTRRYAFLVGSVVGSAVAVLAVMMLLLFCCLKRVGNKVGPKDGVKDENPLLSLCLSSISGSAEESPKQKILKTTTLVVNSTSNSDTSSPYKSSETSQPNNHYKSSETAQPNNNAPLAVPPPPGKKAPAPPSAPAPPPPPKNPTAPPPPPKGVKPPPAPLGKPLPHQRGRSSLGGSGDGKGGSDSQKAKLKPFFWDKVSPDQSMVWQELKAGSFQVNEEMMETLFGYTVAEKTINDERKGSSPTQYIQIIDPKKSQNLSILLKALNVTTEEVCDALMEGNELPSEFIQALLKMAPTSEEELKLRLYNGELSMLGPADRFLKSVVEIPSAFKRMESLLFIGSVQEEISSINDSFETLEVACTELKNSRLFLKLLEAVLKTGNRMNDGTYRGDAQAFKLDTLLKLSDVKGTDGKTTLLHFVVQEIIRSEGVRAKRTLRESQSISSIKSDDLNDDSSPDSPEYYRTLGLNVVSGLSNDLENVRKAAVIDGDAVTNTVYKLGQSLGKIKNFLENEMEGLEGEFPKKLRDFVGCTEDEIKRLVGEEKRIMDLVKGTGDYFYGKGAKNEGLRLFVIVRDFLVMLEKVCKEVRSEKTPVRTQRREAMTPSTSSDSIDIRQRLFPAITANRRDESSSDDESFSP